jgi:D-cysteine desulfhydrase
VREICGVKLPEGMRENERFPEPIITPTTKAEIGEHDADISKEEILAQGQFDVIALACGTGMTQAGLLCGQKLHGGKEQIVGLSVARDADNAKAHIAAYANAWLKEDAIDESRIVVCDAYRQTYGVYDDFVKATMLRMMREHGIPMDGTYTGKAYASLLRLAKEEGWQNKRVLFLHTGGTPLYFDSLA